MSLNRNASSLLPHLIVARSLVLPICIECIKLSFAVCLIHLQLQLTPVLCHVLLLHVLVFPTYVHILSLLVLYAFHNLLFQAY